METNKKNAVTGTQISYFFICQTKLWYFSHHINMEHNSDIVRTGKLIHENTYQRENKEIKIDGISIDFIKKGEILELHEVKKSKKMEMAHEMQALYYIYVLKKKGIRAVAIIDYPTIRERKIVELTLEKEVKLEEAVKQVKLITKFSKPPEAKHLPFCSKCSYYELCWGD
jgi:CRISPR-associated exonuclease Cas4